MSTAPTRRLRAARDFALALCLGIGSANAQNPSGGTITGVVLDEDTKQPIRYVGVFIPGTTIGTMTNATGEFRITHLEPGTYTVRASIVGHEPKTMIGVRVDAHNVTAVRIRLKRSLDTRIDAIVVREDRKRIDVGSSTQEHTGTAKEVLELPVDTVEEAVAINAGVVVKGGEMHVQGSYGHQTVIQIDGVPVNNPLTGSALSLSKLSLDDYSLLTGGLDAEYGNASSVINYQTRAGGRRFSGNFRYSTDDFGRADKTYMNYDQLALGFGGPTPFEDLTYYASGELTYMDGEYSPAKSYPETHYLNGLFKSRERAVARVRGQARLDWKVGRGVRMSGELTLDRGREDPYVHNWNTQGWVGRILQYQAVRPDNFHPGYYTATQERISLNDGPWRTQASGATYIDIRENDACLYCLLPIAGNRLVRAVRVVGRTPGSDRFVLPDYPLFQGYQRPNSTWVPDLEGAPADSNREYYNAADHIPRTHSLTQQLKWTLTHTLSPKTFYEVRLSRLSADATTSVSDQTPEQYASAGRLLWVPGIGPSPVGIASFYTDSSVPFLATAYDYPYYARRRSATYFIRTDLTTQRWSAHRAKAGFHVQYSDLDQATMNYPAQQVAFRSVYGLNRNAFHAFVPEGSFYAQDRWEHEGMVVNAGLRFDFFSPGSGASIDIHSREVPTDVKRWQTQWSPRLGFAFPITDRDVFHFHYGRYIQFPEKIQMLSSQDPFSSTTLGNPNLAPETSIAFQAGIKHQWTRNVSTQILFFNRDLYGGISSRPVTDDSTGVQRLRYVNKSYASSRGVELSYSKAFSHGYAFDLAYTWAFADGVSSDADFGRAAQGLTHLPTGELPLDWDQRHTLNVTFKMARAGEWLATILYQYGSGLPWTPVDRFAKKQDPLLENSRRLPAMHSLAITGEKLFTVYQRQLRLFFEGRNLLDQKQVYAVDPPVWPVPPEVRPAYAEYASETGQFGGAYLRDSDGDGRDEYYPVNDPRVFGPRRMFRIGLGLEF